MKMPLTAVFVFYLAAFLGIVFVSWLTFTWSRYRDRRQGRLVVHCEVCSTAFVPPEIVLRLRCPNCGVVVSEKRVKEN